MNFHNARNRFRDLRLKIGSLSKIKATSNLELWGSLNDLSRLEDLQSKDSTIPTDKGNEKGTYYPAQQPDIPIPTEQESDISIQPKYQATHESRMSQISS